ncbi:helix-turn-helix domain-containing protein [bacterium]|nr:helix-turn-helix domain-containing protein [Bacteroidales bacterium]MBP3821536.1 helix-turn-helix domain-containing protein [bacterium]
MEKGIFITGITREEFFTALQGCKIASDEVKPQPDEMITRQEACKRLNVCLSTIDNWIKSGLLPYSKVGRRVLLQRADVVELITKNKVKK